MSDRSGQSLGAYRLVRLLGQGGFAEVYLGQHIHLNTQAAIKILLATKLNDEAEIESFRREAQIIASLIHANIVRVWDFNIEQKTPFFVMDYAAQGSLRNMHPRGTRLPLSTIITYVRQVADALHYAHNRKQIHRDVKPDNILVRDDGSLMLSDFGIATMAHSSISQHTEEMIGTVAYMAPEQTLGRPHPASDQYALAVTAYEWLAGKPPFRGTTIEIIGQHTSAPPPSLVTQVSGLPAVVEQVLFKALAKEPKDRFATIQEFALALEQANQGIYSPATFPQPLVQQSKPEKKAVPLPTNTSAAPPIQKLIPVPLMPTKPVESAAYPQVFLERLTVQQIETTITHAHEYIDKLRDPLFQQQSAALLVEQIEYWRKQGSKTFKQIVAQLGSTGSNQPDPVRQALSAYLNGVASAILPSLREGISQFQALETQGQDLWKIPNHCGQLLINLVPPASNEQFWLRLLNEFAQPPLYALIKNDSLWPFQLWALEQASKLPQPQRLLPQMQPWLDIPSWDKLREVFALNLPVEWATIAIEKHIQNVPKSVLPLIQKYEPLFIAALQQILQQGSQTNINAASTFFQRMVEYGYPNRIPLLLTLVNTYSESGFVQTIFSCVGIATPYHLQTAEIDTVLAGCRPEVIATCNRTQALANYLQKFILALTPAKLSLDHTTRLLKQIQQLSEGPGLPPLLPVEVANLVSHWLVISAFITASTLDRYQLAKTKTAIEHILRGYIPEHTANPIQIFANEFIPILVKRVRTESDLDVILDTLGTTMTESRWDLLRWMAMLVGQTGVHLYELFPYVACGLREAERTGKITDDLDAYLRALFFQKNRELLTKVDVIVSNDIWPDARRQILDNWRSRNKKGDLPIPSFRSNTGRLAAEQQALRLPDPGNYASIPFSSREQTNNALTPQSTPDQPDNVLPAQAQSLARVVVSLPALNRSITYEEYTKMHQVMPALLSYWLSERLPELSLSPKLFTFENKTLQQINKDLSDAPTLPSRNLVLYLADDVMIEEAIKSRVVPGTVVAQTLDPERYLSNELSSFVAFIQSSTTNETLYKNGLRVLIRRYLVINRLENNKNSLNGVFGKGGLVAFLEKERAKYSVSRTR